MRKSSISFTWGNFSVAMPWSPVRQIMLSSGTGLPTDILNQTKLLLDVVWNDYRKTTEQETLSKVFVRYDETLNLRITFNQQRSALLAGQSIINNELCKLSWPTFNLPKDHKILEPGKSFLYGIAISSSRLHTEVEATKGLNNNTGTVKVSPSQQHCYM